MIRGHMTFHSRRQAFADLQDYPEFVWCPSCRAVEGIHVIDNGFGDQFGGVSDWRVETDCGDDPEDCIKACAGCGEKLEEDSILHQVIYNRTEPRKKNWADDWFCPKCYEEYKKELQSI